MAIFDKILRSGEGKKLKALQGLIPDINALEVEYAALSDEEIRGKTGEFRQRLEKASVSGLRTPGGPDRGGSPPESPASG